MNENPNENRNEQPGSRTGHFKLNIDERELATGEIERPKESGNRLGAYSDSAYNRSFATDEERRAEKKAHKKRNRLKARKNKRVFSLVWLCMVVLIALTLASYLIGGANDFFAVGRNPGTAEIVIPENVTEKELAELLYAKGAIREPEFFSLYCKITTEMEYFEPGTYQADTNLDYEDLINTLQYGTEEMEEVRVTFPEGSNALEIAQLLEENEVCTQEEFLAALNGDFSDYDMIGSLGDGSGKYYKLEGYLFPDTYDFWKGEDLDSVIGKMLYNFQLKMSDTVRASVEQSGMTLDQVITLASIIQNEAANDSDMYNVSAVLHNRMDWGWEAGIYRLECDSTTFYPYKNRAAVPAAGALPYGNYDTYQIEGLPAGAICNPGMDAINAALRPRDDGDANDWLYFCHAEDGTAYYATNESDHLYNRQQAGLD